MSGALVKAFERMYKAWASWIDNATELRVEELKTSRAEEAQRQTIMRKVMKMMLKSVSLWAWERWCEALVQFKGKRAEDRKNTHVLNR